jgi:hypothetical protein
LVEFTILCLLLELFLKSLILLLDAHADTNTYKQQYGSNNHDNNDRVNTACGWSFINYNLGGLVDGNILIVTIEADATSIRDVQLHVVTLQEVVSQNVSSF